MATVAVNNTYDRTEQPVGVQDIAGVRSRVNWGAILAGSVMALALYFLLTLLGTAIGFSISGKVSAKAIGISAAIYAIVVIAISLFVGGFAASQLTTGENKREAAMYGLIVWAMVFAMLLWLMATGVQAGFTAMVGIATTGATVADATGQNTAAADFEDAARRAGYSQQQINDFKERVKNLPAEVKAAAEEPANKAKAEEAARKAGEAATQVTWWTFLGTLLSMLAAVGGGYVGAGPTFRLFTVPVARTRLS